MIRLEMKNCNTTLIEKLQKYQHYHRVKWININILQAKEYYLSIKVSLYQGRVIEQAKFTYFPLEKSFKKQITTIEVQEKKEVETLKVMKDAILKDHLNGS